MTPKEKAIELVEQFSSVLMHDEFYEDSVMCALVAVDEIIKERYFHIDHYTHSNLKYHIELELSNRLKETRIYWNEVKHELEKL